MKRLLSVQLFVFLTFSASASVLQGTGNVKDLVDNLNSSNCTENMAQATYALDHLDSDDILQSIENSGHETLSQNLWEIKISAHERLRSFHRTDSLTAECANAIRGTLRGLRTYEDYVGEHYLRSSQGRVLFPDNAFAENNIHVKKHPDFAGVDLNKDLKSGDIILSRGNAYTSAAIASLGEFDTQFSHLSVVYKDDEGKFWTVEAHIEVGSFVRPLQDHIDDKNYRTMVFRFDDEKVAAKAAKYIYEKVKKASDTTGNILYDFGFDLDNNEKYFCSEVASVAYSYGSDGKVNVPMFRSRLQTRKSEFVNMLEINVESSFIPADIEVDPRFTVVAEWRDANRTNDNLRKDAVLQAMFKWSDDFGYLLKQGSSGKSLLYRNVAWPLRRVPFLKKYFVDKLPINMSRKLIGYFGVLESAGEFMHKKLNVVDDESITQNDIPLLKSEKYESLEKFRVEDKQSKKKKFHKMFRPKSKS